jgi:hypothetical protein
VFARAEYNHDRVFSFEADPQNPLEVRRVERSVDGLRLSVPSARAGLRVDVRDTVGLVIEADFGAPRPTLKDGYLQLKRKHWRVRAGQFKMPISSFVLESPWTLPLARRGLLDDVLSEHMLLFGRRQGAQGRIEGGGSWDPSLTLAVFQPVAWGADAEEPLRQVALSRPDLVARAEVSPGGVVVAAVGQRRVTSFTSGTRAFWAAGLDATTDFEGERTGLRLWAEAFAGSSWFDGDPADARTATFVTARALAAFRWGGLRKADGYLEVFASGGLLEPDTSVVADLLWEGVAGLNVGHWRQTRLTLQLELDTAGRNLPASLFTPFGMPPFSRHLAVVVQAGAAF